MKRFIVTGAPGAGKTTLLDRLSDEGYCVVREAATDVITAEQATGVAEPWAAERFIADVLRVQVARQSEAPPAPVVLFDRSPICTLALARYSSRSVPPELAAEIARLVSVAFYERDVFLVRPLGFVEPTAARRITYADSLAFEAIHEATYRDLGFTLHEVAADTPERRAAAVGGLLSTLV